MYLLSSCAALYVPTKGLDHLLHKSARDYRRLFCRSALEFRVRHFLLIRHTRPGSWGGRGAGAGRYIDSPPPPPQSPLVAEGRLEPSPRRPAAGCSTVGNTLLSPTPHISLFLTHQSPITRSITLQLSPLWQVLSMLVTEQVHHTVVY